MAVVFVWHILFTTSCLRRDVLGSMTKKHANVSEVSEIFFLVNTFGFLGFWGFVFVIVVVFY